MPSPRMLGTPPHVVIFQQALGVLPPWTIEEVTFSRGDGRLDITVEYGAGAQFLCPSCGEIGGVHDHRPRTWRHLNFFQYETYLHAEVPRIRCDRCRTTTAVPVPWARKGSGFTLLFEALVVQLAQAMPLAVLGRYVGEHDTRLLRIIRHYVGGARERLDLSTVRTVGIDETSRAKGHSYITVCSDLDAGRVCFVTPGKDATTIARFSEDLRLHGGDPTVVTDAVIDLSPAFMKGVAEHLPNAQVTFDHFHVVGLMNDALDAVRRQEQREVPSLTGTRYALLRNPSTASPEQRAQVAALPKRHCRTVRAYALKLALQDAYAAPDRPRAEEALQRWYRWATHSRIPQVIRTAKTIKRHWDGILRYFDRRLSNGRVEGMNGIIQTLKRRARGYRNTDHLITMIYLICGKLPFQLPSLAPTFAGGGGSHHG